MKKYEVISRRTMLALSAGALGALGLPSGVARAQRRGPARIALIGCGRRGEQILPLLGDNVGVVCDVDSRRLDVATGIVGTAKRHDDYRRVLDDRGIDGVVIATPDHWHAIQACEAIEAGKDVYLETPVCLTPGDATRLVTTARNFGAVVCTGEATHWTRGEPVPYEVDEKLPDRGLTRVSCWGDDNVRGGDVTLNGPAPEELNWEAWLGPARWRPYNSGFLDGNARYVLGLGGGELATQGSRVFQAVLDALGIDTLGTVRVSSRGTPSLDGFYDAPQAMRVEYYLPGEKVHIVWQQRKSSVNDQRFGARYRRDGALTTLTPLLWTEQPGPNPERRALAKSLRSWLDAMELRPDTMPGLRRAAQSATLAALGNIAYRVGRTVTWDADEATFPGDPIAGRLVDPPRRRV